MIPIVVFFVIIQQVFSEELYIIDNKCYVFNINRDMKKIFTISANENDMKNCKVVFIDNAYKFLIHTDFLKYTEKLILYKVEPMTNLTFTQFNLKEIIITDSNIDPTSFKYINEYNQSICQTKYQLDFLMCCSTESCVDDKNSNKYKEICTPSNNLLNCSTIKTTVWDNDFNSTNNHYINSNKNFSCSKVLIETSGSTMKVFIARKFIEFYKYDI